MDRRAAAVPLTSAPGRPRVLTASSASGVPACCAMPIVRRLAVSRASSEPRLPRRGNQNSLCRQRRLGPVHRPRKVVQPQRAGCEPETPARFILDYSAVTAADRLALGTNSAREIAADAVSAKRHTRHQPKAPSLLEEIDNERSVLAQAQASTHHHTHHPAHHTQGKEEERGRTHATQCALRGEAHTTLVACWIRRPSMALDAWAKREGTTRSAAAAWLLVAALVKRGAKVPRPLGAASPGRALSGIRWSPGAAADLSAIALQKKSTAEISPPPKFHAIA